MQQIAHGVATSSTCNLFLVCVRFILVGQHKASEPSGSVAVALQAELESARPEGHLVRRAATSGITSATSDGTQSGNISPSVVELWLRR